MSWTPLKIGRKKKPILQFHNTLTQTLQPFSPLRPDLVKMYNCGPTVYGTQHIGNMRAAVFADLLRRTLEEWGYTVKQTINITDFGHLTSDADEGDDKMSTGLKREGMALTLENMRILAEKYAQEYFNDIETLGLTLDKITFPRASDYIAEQISVIQTLEEKGYAYVTSQGVYFEVSRFPEYGKLGNINLEGQMEGARVQENSEKRGPFDFILWKSDDTLGWESPWGLGFPGWHIECTAMIFAILGKQIDIHTGGIEHIPVHHNNEIAQAEAASGKKFVQYWLHYDHITIDGKKISKSLGNTIYLRDIQEKNISPFTLRYWFMTANYRSSANFTWDALEASATALGRLQRMYREYKDESLKPQNNSLEPSLRGSSKQSSIESKKPGLLLSNRDRKDDQFEQEFLEAIGNDLDTPKALALVWDYMKTDTSPAQKLSALELANRLLGLGFEYADSTASQKTSITIENTPPEVQALLQAREEARKNKDFTKADELRNKILELGFEVKDTPQGPETTLLK